VIRRCATAFLLVALTLVGVTAARAAGVDTGGPLDRGEATRLFDEANRLYSDGRYQEAADRYQEILDSGFQNPDVHYNLGNAWYESGNVGRAVLEYERALKLDPALGDARENLEFVRQLLADRQVPVGGPLAGALGAAAARATPHRLALVATASYFLLFAALIAGVRRRGMAVWLARLAAVAAVILAISLGGLVFRVVQTRARAEAVVLAGEVGARTGPSDDYVLEFRLHEGTVVRLIETRDEWSRVAVGGTDLEGWLPSDTIERI
jgi:hypothetical protein